VVERSCNNVVWAISVDDDSHIYYHNHKIKSIVKSSVVRRRWFTSVVIALLANAWSSAYDLKRQTRASCQRSRLTKQGTVERVENARRVSRGGTAGGGLQGH
jgi:hypothetical protein